MKQHIVEKILSYSAVFEPCEEGGFTVTVPKLPGVITEGDTFEEAKTNVEDALKGILKFSLKPVNPFLSQMLTLLAPSLILNFHTEVHSPEYNQLVCPNCPAINQERL